MSKKLNTRPDSPAKAALKAQVAALKKRLATTKR